MIAALLIPLVGAVLIVLTGRQPNLRETVTLVTALLMFASVTQIVAGVIDGGRPEVFALDVAPGLSLAFQAEPLGMLFALIASFLWIVNSIYSIGYMRGNREPRQTQFYVAFAVALAATMGIALSANLFTLFIFYEVLTLSTYPLVAHHADAKARSGARTYLMILIGTSIVFFIPALLWTLALAGTLDFKPGGILVGAATAQTTGLLLALFAFGIGKAAVMPFHRWLPSAMVAPTPVSALLHAVAVVKAGVFSILKVVVYIFGPEHLLATGASEWLVYLATFSLLAASVVALTKDNLKARLAYSTVSQLSYIVLGAAIATPLALVGAAMHVATHAFGKITLFFVAGAIHTATHKTEVSQLNGIGRAMPFTMAAFFIGALSIIGLPPLGGAWSKLYIALGGMDGDYGFVVAALMISSVLNVAYLMPIVVRAFFTPPDDGVEVTSIKEAPWLCVIPLCFTALACGVLFFLPDRLEVFLGGIMGGN
ncbi:MAG: monovalent cation/H+ antiporter subunit D family protein [Alphaproteobacteria bacterium]|nr:monovalent cation/H+ antiporter subunit D family protein [Alphaproteobacteria bacterium]